MEWKINPLKNPKHFLLRLCIDTLRTPPYGFGDDYYKGSIDILLNSQGEILGGKAFLQKQRKTRLLSPGYYFPAHFPQKRIPLWRKITLVDHKFEK